MDRVIFVLKEETGEYGFYGNLNLVMDDYPHLKKSTVSYRVSRKGVPYRDNKVRIFRGPVKRRPFRPKKEVSED